MKRISVALALLAASTAAIANTGTIQFKGKITDATCAIEVVDPISGAVNSMIQLGNYSKDYFTGANQRTPARAFQLLIKDGAKCGFTAGDKVTVTYTGLDGVSGNYYGIKGGNGSAGGIAVALKDKADDVKPDTPSTEYVVNETGETRLSFSAALVSTAAAVTAGAVDSDIQFVVNLP